MKNNQNPQSNQNAFPARSNASKTKKIHAEVWQDKARFSRARIASHQPAPVKNSLRAHAMNRNAPRSQNYTKGRIKSVKVTTWVKPIVKSELERISVQEGISVSAAAAAFLEKSLQQHIDLQYSALLTPHH